MEQEAKMTRTQRIGEALINAFGVAAFCGAAVVDFAAAGISSLYNRAVGRGDKPEHQHKPLLSLRVFGPGDD